MLLRVIDVFVGLLHYCLIEQAEFGVGEFVFVAPATLQKELFRDQVDICRQLLTPLA